MTQLGSWTVVTGGSSPIGFQIAKDFAERGSSVILQGFRDLQTLKEAEEEIGRLGVGVRTYRANFAESTELDSFCDFALAESGGTISNLVIASASGVMKPARDLTRRHLEWTFAVTAFPVLQLCAVLNPTSTVAISSLGSERTVPDYAAVGSSKAALEAFVRYLAVELAPACRVNAISAGLVDTPSALLLPAYEELRSEIVTRTPMGRLATPKDISRVATWLCGPDAEMLTGEVLHLDGGQRLQL